MQIVELGDCSMVIMKDSSDYMSFSVGKLFRRIREEEHADIEVAKAEDQSVWQTSSGSIYTAGRLLLFFKETIRPEFKLHDKVILYAM